MCLDIDVKMDICLKMMTFLIGIMSVDLTESGKILMLLFLVKVNDINFLNPVA